MKGQMTIEVGMLRHQSYFFGNIFPLKAGQRKRVISAILITPPPAKEFVRRAGLPPLILRGGDGG